MTKALRRIARAMRAKRKVLEYRDTAYDPDILDKVSPEMLAFLERLTNPKEEPSK
jgi:hypothetical protein